MNGTSSRRTQIVRRSRPLRAPRGLFETDANVEGVAARYAAASAWRWLAQIEPAPGRGSPLSKADDCGALVAGQVSSRDRSRVLGMARLEDYSFGRIVVDGEEQTRDLIVLPHRVLTNWWRREGHSLALEDLTEVEDELPERLILGTGARGRLRPPRTVIEELERRGIDVEVLQTDDAVRRYGDVDERRTAAALHLTC